MTTEKLSLEREIKARAFGLGFSLCGITTPGLLEHYPIYEDWINRGHHAGMSYLGSEYHREKRRDPASLFPDLQLIIVVGLAYHLASDSTTGKPDGLLAGYAAGMDYHLLIPDKLAPLLTYLDSLTPGAPSARVFTDSAPILERELAVKAGLGWIGRNSCILNPTVGSAFLLAEIFTSIPLNPDPPFEVDRCGSCHRCVSACPTACILSDRTVDANRCLSYQTIENRGLIPPGIMEKMGNRLFGCDICQSVCPWNQHAGVVNEGSNNNLPIDEMINLLDIDDTDFRARFGKSAFSRTKRTGFIRNLMVVLGNLGAEAAIEKIERYIRYDADTILQATARWSLEKLRSR